MKFGPVKGALYIRYKPFLLGLFTIAIAEFLRLSDELNFYAAPTHFVSGSLCLIIMS